MITVHALNYGISFEHGMSHGIHHTKCSIIDFNSDNEVTISEGISFCSPEDVFNKETGRKIALARAVSKLSRPVRKEIWNAYFSRSLKYISYLKRSMAAHN